jgi:uncharacterized protein (TIGR02246 family)
MKESAAPTPEKAHEPEDLYKLWIKRANAGDAQGLAALYETDAVIAFPPGRISQGRDAITELYEHLVAQGPHFDGEEQLPTLRIGDLALTSTRRPDGSVRAQVARRQPDGTWLRVLDRPSFV